MKMLAKIAKTAALPLIFMLLLLLPFGLARAAGAESRSVLKSGSTGEEVAELERELRAVGLLDFELEPKGVYDERVEAAVKKLQRRLGVTVDGLYGAITDKAYKKAVASGALVPHYVEDLPLYGFVIGIDAGHQASADLTLEPIAPGSCLNRYAMTEGTFGVRTNTPESEINLAVSVSLSELLESNGAKVVLSRDTEDTFVSNRERAALMNSSSVDFWIRIHCDHSNDPRVFGSRVLLPNSIQNYNIARRSALLGDCIIRNFCDITGAFRLVPRALTGETGFNWSSVPVVALELGYLSNAASDLALSTPSYRALCADGIVRGIAEYYFKLGELGLVKYSALIGASSSIVSEQTHGGTLNSNFGFFTLGDAPN